MLGPVALGRLGVETTTSPPVPSNAARGHGAKRITCDTQCGLKVSTFLQTLDICSFAAFPPKEN